MSLILADSQTTRISYSSIANASGEEFYGTSFTAESSYTLKALDLYVMKSGSSVMSVVGKIYADDGNGQPGTLLGTSTNSLDSSAFDASDYAWSGQLTFAGVSIVSGSRYHIVAENSTIDSSNYYRWGRNTTAQGEYINDSSAGSVWTTEYTDNQLNFRTYYDDSSGGTTYDETITEALTLEDSASGPLTIPAIVAETLGLTDSANLKAEISITVAESLNLIDSASTGGTVIDLVVNETISLADTASLAKTINETIAESVSLTDAINAAVAINVTVDENLSLSDQIVALATFNLAIAESLELTDAVSSGDVVDGSLQIRITAKSGNIQISGQTPTIRITYSAGKIRVTEES